MHTRIWAVSVAAVTLLSIVLVGDVRAADDFKPPAKEDFRIFLLVGQSNMAGRGAVEEQDKKPHPRVVTLDKAGKWVPAVDPIHFDKPNIAGVGLGTTFGKVIADRYPGDVIGLLPCAFGGTSIDQWSSDKKDGLYADAIRRSRIALKDGVLAGILWHQGEADAGKSDVYAEKAAKLFAAFRQDLEAPNVPIVVGVLGEFHAGKDRINAVLRSLPKSITNLAVAESEGLGHKGDKVHFDAAAYREFGRRYAAKWLELTVKASKTRSE